jgi:hypothetical protein
MIFLGIPLRGRAIHCKSSLRCGLSVPIPNAPPSCFVCFINWSSILLLGKSETSKFMNLLYWRLEQVCEGFVDSLFAGLY